MSVSAKADAGASAAAAGTKAADDDKHQPSDEDSDSDDAPLPKRNTAPPGALSLPTAATSGKHKEAALSKPDAVAAAVRAALASRNPQPKKAAGAGAAGKGASAAAADDDEDDGEGEGDEDDELSVVRLGLLEKAKHPAQLQARFFPSKVGGKPAWLNPRDVPDAKSLACGVCGEPLRFLLQIYAATGEHDTDPTYHRMLYVYACLKGACIRQAPAKALKCLRAQLPRKNEFWPLDNAGAKKAALAAPTESLPPEAPYAGVNLCQVCGAKATAHCGTCKTVYYCGRAHQAQDWSDAHKSECAAWKAKEPQSAAEQVKGATRRAKRRFEEYAIKSIDEPYESDDEPAAGAGADGKSAPAAAGAGGGDKLTAHAKELLAAYEKAKAEEGDDDDDDDQGDAGDDGDDDDEDGDDAAAAGGAAADGKMKPAAAAGSSGKPKPQKPAAAAGAGAGAPAANGKAKAKAAAATDAKDDTPTDDQVDEIGPYGEIVKKDKAYKAFKKRVAREPRQILRFVDQMNNDLGTDQDPNTTPLWVCEKGAIPSTAVPRCPYCHGPRDFEFQILPQLLFYLGVDADTTAESASAAALAASGATAPGTAAAGASSNAAAAAPASSSSDAAAAAASAGAGAAGAAAAAAAAPSTAAATAQTPAAKAMAAGLPVSALGGDPLDFGTLVVYTCMNSCGDGSKAYFDEYVYCQPMAD